MSIHVIGIVGLVVVFITGTLRPINLGALALVTTYVVGTLFVGESLPEMYSGFPVDLLVLLAGVTYLFGVAVNNGTVEWIVDRATHLFKGRRAMIPWIVFVVSSLPAMAGALGSAGVAMLAPLSLRLAKRYDIDRRMIGLMVVHGAAAGNFSPLNVLGAIVLQAVTSSGLEMSTAALFFGNLAYNCVLAVIIYVAFGGLGLGAARPARDGAPEHDSQVIDRLRTDQLCTLAALVGVATAALGFDLSIGFLALAAAVTLQLLFPT
ncbi:MAG: SLC13 family permease, partial [Gemmatimonadota bacterium]